jgi:hypothetical protein
MPWSWIFGYLLAVILIWIGLAGWGRGMKPTTQQLFLVVGSSLMVVMIVFTLGEAFNWWDKFPRSLIGAAGILIVLDRCVRITIGRKRGGPMLLDLGRVRGPDMMINLFTGAALTWFAVTDIVEIVPKIHWTFQDISFQIFGLSLAFAVVIQGVSKRRLVERGVFHGTGLSTWEKFEGFTWEKESTTSSTLVLHKRAKNPFFRLLTLTVRSEQLQDVEEVLLQHDIPRKGVDSEP